MNLLSPQLKAVRHSALGLCLALGLLGAGAQVATAQQAPSNQPSERAANDLAKIQPLIDGQDWNGVVELMQTILRYAAPNSFDQALANDILSKAYLQLGDYATSLPPLELAYNLGATNSFFDEKSQLERLYLLAQLYYQEASTVKVPSTQAEYLTKAIERIEQWISLQDEPSQDGRMFYISLLYNQATRNPENIDMAFLKKAQEQCYLALNSELAPKESLYLILIATLQQEGDFKRTTEYLELLAKQYPTKATYWQQLFATYSNLSVEAKRPEESESYSLRAILTLERAQALGFMNTPKDNYNLVGIYFNIGQFGKATDLLHAGLRSGAIEPDIKKWELLAYSFLQVNRELTAIEVLKEAIQAFPESGQLDNQIAQIYYSLNQSEQSYRYLNSALAKGGLDNIGAVHYFKAYICFELQKFDEALVAINLAAELQRPENPQLPGLRQAIQDAIINREAATQAL
ncbi:hypothetical protein AXK11_00660 [Cephaloticoccus primus]|uniref:Uncharacterized protein n=1 Tax=Cephaloticoccus primus TaxID=1548207 RepID=A0A139SM37_9BACT|nr:hypothetical protein [Cephaloticoccus primus]KXU35591.1 hypothetical protein AXK11_00660 [Cephaloticoccus primus]